MDRWIGSRRGWGNTSRNRWRSRGHEGDESPRVMGQVVQSGGDIRASEEAKKLHLVYSHLALVCGFFRAELSTRRRRGWGHSLVFTSPSLEPGTWDLPLPRTCCGRAHCRCPSPPVCEPDCVAGVRFGPCDVSHVSGLQSSLGCKRSGAADRE
jgi:hypothetical protein